MRRDSTILILLLFLSVFFAACTVRPRNVLTGGEMEDVLYDLHRAEGILQAKGYAYGHDEENAAYYEAILRKHGVTQAEFDSSLVWYTDNPRRFDKIYPKVVERLQAEKEALALINGKSFREQTNHNKPRRSVAQMDSAMRVLTDGYPLSWTMIVDTLAPRKVAMYSYIFPVAAQDSIRHLQILTSADSLSVDTDTVTGILDKDSAGVDTVANRSSLQNPVQIKAETEQKAASLKRKL